MFFYIFFHISLLFLPFYIKIDKESKINERILHFFIELLSLKDKRVVRSDYMNQEQIGSLIKKIRTENNLSQQKFAERYGVTYQAVSKWENGKNIPDISILKQICDDYHMDLNDFLSNKVTQKKKKNMVKIILPIVILFIVGIALVFFAIQKNKEDNFEFKTLSSSCDNFTLYGSIAYNKKKSSIYISNLTYCGGKDTKVYKEITCALYENEENTKVEISKCNHKNNQNKTLEEFIKDVNFKVDNYESTCSIYEEDTLHLEIDATDFDGETTTYKIPLKLEENCDN